MADFESVKRSADIGARWTEINTIFGRIRRRMSGEPTQKEKERLAVLKEEIAALKRGEWS